MNALVGYGSSDEDDDIQPEKPAKLARIESKTEPAKPIVTEAPPSIATTPPPPNPNNQSISNHANSPAPTAALVPTAAFPTPTQGPSTQIETDDPPFSPYTYERQRLRELTMPAVPNFSIPDSPPPPPHNSESAAALAATTKKFERFLELKKQGVHFNERLQNSSSLRNPSLLPKLMDFAGISAEESYASSLPAELAVPVKWPEECYVENLMRLNERREKKRLAERDKVEFVAAGKAGGSSASGTPAGDVSRKSRFDKR